MRTLLDFLADTGRPELPAVIEPAEGGFRLCAEVYAWGQVVILFTGCTFRVGEEMPQGKWMLRRLSIRREEERYEVALSVSPEGGSATQRSSIFFFCAGAETEERFVRYTEHAGLPPAALLREQCAMFSLQLLTKAYALDEDGLTHGEQALLDRAWFAVMNAPPEYADALAALYGEDALEGESRIREIRACGWIDGGGPLKEAIEAFHEADEAGDDRRLRRAQKELFTILEDPAQKSLHGFYHQLFDDFLQANEAFSPRRETEGTAACLQYLDAFLHREGFTGAFPHYRRKRGRRGEFLSFAWAIDFEQEEPATMLHLIGGVAFLVVEVAGPIPFERMNAFDCEWKTSKGRCAVLGAFSDLAQERRILQEALLAFDGRALPVGKNIVPVRAVFSAAASGALAGAAAALVLYALLACALFIGKLMGRTARWLLLTQLRFWVCILLAAALLGAIAAVAALYYVSRYPLGRQAATIK